MASALRRMASRLERGTEAIFPGEGLLRSPRTLALAPSLVLFPTGEKFVDFELVADLCLMFRGRLERCWREVNLAEHLGVTCLSAVNVVRKLEACSDCSAEAGGQLEPWMEESEGTDLSLILKKAEREQSQQKSTQVGGARHKWAWQRRKKSAGVL